jgi:hypothetical protein
MVPAQLKAATLLPPPLPIQGVVIVLDDIARCEV